MGMRLVHEVLESYHGPARHKLWLVAWALNARSDTRSGWCPRWQLARHLGVSERQADRIASALIAEGILKRDGHAYRGHSTIYVLGDLPVNGSGTPSASRSKRDSNDVPHSGP